MRVTVTNPNAFAIVVTRVTASVRPVGARMPDQERQDHAVARPRSRRRARAPTHEARSCGCCRAPPTPARAHGSGSGSAGRRFARDPTGPARRRLRADGPRGRRAGGGGGVVGRRWLRIRLDEGGFGPDRIAPSGSVTGRNVTVSWPAARFPDNTAVNGYTVQRYDGAHVAQTVGASCSGTINALTCTEAAVPPGTWTYTVTPKQAQWIGTTSADSAGRHRGRALVVARARRPSPPSRRPSTGASRTSSPARRSPSGSTTRRPARSCRAP